MLRNLIHDVRAITAEAIRKTGKDKPADAALREVLKSPKRDLSIMNKYFWTWKSSKAN